MAQSVAEDIEYQRALNERINLLRNNFLEEIAKKVESLSGRKRGEINRETAQMIRKMKRL